MKETRNKNIDNNNRNELQQAFGENSWKIHMSFEYICKRAQKLLLILPLPF